MAGADTHGLRTIVASASIILIAWYVVWVADWPPSFFLLVTAGTVFGGLLLIVRRFKLEKTQASNEPLPELVSAPTPTRSPVLASTEPLPELVSSPLDGSSEPLRGEDKPEAGQQTPTFRKLAQAYQDGQLVAFVGAGVTRAAGLPTGAELVEQVREYARGEEVSESALKEVDDLKLTGKPIEALTQLSCALGRPRFIRIVKELLNDEAREIPPLGKALAALVPNLRAVLTTNLDRLVERAFGSSWVEHRRPQAELARNRKFILKLHGTLQDSDTWVLTRDQYDQAMYADPRHQPVFRALMLGAPMLFVGFGFDDPDLNAVLGEIRAMAQGEPPQHFALVPRPIREWQRRTMAEAGVSLIGYDNSDGTDAGAVRVLEALSMCAVASGPALQPQAARQRLHQLLTDVFSIDDLQQIVMYQAFVDDAVYNAVEWGREGWVDSLIDVCGSEGRIPSAFFDALLNKCPEQAGEIHVLKQYWTRAVAVSPQAKVPSKRRRPAAGGHSENIVPTQKTPPDRVHRMDRVALFLDRSACWNELKVACHNPAHIGVVIHGAAKENIELFLGRIKRSFNAKEELDHGYVEVPLILEERHALVPEDWEKRICKILQLERRVGLVRGLKKKTQKRPLVLLFTGPVGPLFAARRGTQGGLTQQEQDGLDEFLSAYLPSKLAGVAFKHPVRLIVPVEYPTLGTKPTDAFFRRIRNAFDRAQGIEHVKVQPIAGIPWVDVWHTIEFEFGGYPPDGFDVPCKKEYDRVTKKGDYTFLEVADAIGALVHEVKEHGI